VLEGNVCALLATKDHVNLFLYDGGIVPDPEGDHHRRSRVRKADMVRTIVYLLVAIVVLGTIATPGLGALALVVAPLLGLGLLWRIALTVSNHGRPLDAVVHTRQSHLLGPGGRTTRSPPPLSMKTNTRLKHQQEQQ
jgi:hypothetical protein